MKNMKKERGWQKRIVAVAFCLAALMMVAGPAQAQSTGEKGLSGFYIGAVVGYADGKYSSDMSAEIDHEPKGAILGLQAGWSKPVGPVILGIDGDFAYTSIDGEDTITILGYKSDVNHDVNYLGTLRARVGFMAGPVMIYGTGGFAFANLDNKLSVSYYGQHVGSDEKSSWHTGWTIGAGAEYPVTQNISLGLEYLFVDMGKEEVSMNISGYPVTDKGNLDLHTVRLGVKYRF